MDQKIEYVKEAFPSYLNRKDCIAASDIKNFLSCPKNYFYKKYEEKRAEKDRHFLFGSAWHELVMEPEKWHEHYYISKKIDLRTKDGKELYKQFKEQNEGKECVFEEEFIIMEAMAKSVRENKTFLSLIENAHFELSAYTVDEPSGLKIKLRPDVFCVGKSTIADLKSCLNSSAKKFKYDALSFGYDISAAYYKHFLNRKNYLFVSCEKEAPYNTSIYQLSENINANAMGKIRMALDLLKFCYSNNHFPDYNQFAIMKEMYFIDALPNYFEQLENNNLIFNIE